jgi:F-type H+-transporting ATPase subunit b
MPQLDISTYVPQIFWLSIIFSLMLGVFIGVFLPKLSRILQKRFDAVEQDDSKIKNLSELTLKLQKSYDMQKNEILKTTQSQIDTSLASVRDLHEKRLHALEAEIQQELNRIRSNHGLQSENFAANYEDIINEAVELTLKKLVG